jgi:hypothetical protein
VADGFVVTAILAASDPDPWLASTVEHLGREGVAVRMVGSTDGAPRADVLGRVEQVAATLATDWIVVAEAGEVHEAAWNATLREALREVDRLGYDAVELEPLEFPAERLPAPGEDLRTAFPFYRPQGLGRKRGELRCFRKRPGDPVDLVAHDGALSGVDRRVFPVRFLVRRYVVGPAAPTGIHPFDEGAVRLRLWLGNRESERMEARARAQADSLAATQAALAAAEQACLRRERELDDERAHRDHERAVGELEIRSLRECAGEQALREAELADQLATLDRERRAEREHQADLLRIAHDGAARQDAELARVRAELAAASERAELADAARERAEEDARKASQDRASADRLRAEAERQGAEAERQRAEAGQHRAEAERQRAEAERQRAEAERQRAEAETHRRAMLESRIWRWSAPLRALLDRSGRG